MIKRRKFLKLMAAPAVMTAALPRSALAKEKVTYAYLLDPAYDAVTWAMSNGKITSDLIDVEARGLAIPQLIQATSAKQYDVIMTAVIAVPPAAARGLELRVLSTALQQSPAGEGAGVWGANPLVRTCADYADYDPGHLTDDAKAYIATIVGGFYRSR